MSVETRIWRIDNGLKPLVMSHVEKEKYLEDSLQEDVLGLDMMIIGRQVPTAFGKRIDLLGIDSSGNVVVVELKRDKTPREVVAQLLDYGSWVNGLGFDDILAIYASGGSAKTLAEAFVERFGVALPDQVNEAHQLVIVASDLDASTERIVEYLSSGYGVPINAVFFRYFTDDDRAYLTRSWLMPPVQLEGSAPGPGGHKQQPWNGTDFYVSFGQGPERSWEDAVQYGFVSAGGGLWYSETLKQLGPGHRVFVCVPGTGYVGVGKVTAPAVMAKDFKVKPPTGTAPLLDAPLKATNMGVNAEDPDTAEWVVAVEWTKTVPLSNAFWEIGLFANQNTACRLRDQNTINRVSEFFGVEDAD